MGLKLASKIGFAKNFVRPSAVTSVTTTNITSFQLGFGKDNLKYADPWLLMKTLGIAGGDPSIEIEFSSAKTINCFGIVNHDNIAVPADIVDSRAVLVQYHDGVSFVTIGAFVIRSDEQHDKLIYFDTILTRTKFRIVLTGATADFSIGSMFWGLLTELSQNPENRSAPMVQTIPLNIEESGGGARHLLFGANKKSIDQDFVFVNQPNTDMSILMRLPRQEMIAVLPHEQGPVGVTAEGTPHLFGYVESVSSSPVGGSSSALYKYDTSLKIVGAV